jgi:mannose/cellobiose epimerase-like protein (N-acyl-D-glucosamine 2-epimerase family)
MQGLDSREARRVELDRLLGFARGAAPGQAGPFGYLDARGQPDPDEGYPLWVTSRMTHVFGLAALLDRDGARELTDRGVDALLDVFRDPEHGGWFGHLAGDLAVVDDRKAMYEHAFVLLAATTATRAGAKRAEDLLADVLAVVERYFWDADAGACRESWDRAWTQTEDYRGANSNMHAVEALLAAGQVTGDPVWTQRALRISERVVHRDAAQRGWWLPEHYTSSWEVLPDYNRESPRDRFRPFGVTVGHMIEWARLMVHLESALDDPPAWLVADATSLFDTAMRIGWEADGHPGLIYTLDWQGRPVVTERMHWVAIEAAVAADALRRRTGDDRFAAWERRLWQAVEPFVDREHGSWHHELAPSGAVSTTVWSGKPDAYHAVQGMLLPDLPLTPSLAASVVRWQAG